MAMADRRRSAAQPEVAANFQTADCDGDGRLSLGSSRRSHQPQRSAREVS
jgi:hypothetical protein